MKGIAYSFLFLGAIWLYGHHQDQIARDLFIQGFQAHEQCVMEQAVCDPKQIFNNRTSSNND
jgi:hypothetical protein